MVLAVKNCMFKASLMESQQITAKFLLFGSYTFIRVFHDHIINSQSNLISYNWDLSTHYRSTVHCVKEHSPYVFHCSQFAVYSILSIVVLLCIVWKNCHCLYSIAVSLICCRSCLRTATVCILCIVFLLCIQGLALYLFYHSLYTVYYV